MKKILTIEGMQCEHCKASVEKALTELDGVASAKADLKKKTATVTLSENVEDAALSNAVKEAGFTVTDIQEKRGIF